ncbi:putative inactive receptor-like kinase SSP [Raphanus sativus]|uniref:Serine/threonine-protein kinase BSK n=1 Tax=Raphanus sativus TaxID=3726 RepID=A0A6J0L7Z7_RAPSA|nr:probable inactive receptor-like kinase BSK12 [Raphanus sativus]KAJ4876862.1 putative inactive receptor-like kinase SSP [Raphanus sativus]
MGCCHSTSSGKVPQQRPNQNQGEGHPPLTKFSFSDLNMATENFSLKNIVSESGGGSSNIVYKGRLQNRGLIAIKKFNNMAWPDPKTFVEKAHRVGGIKHKRLVNLIGYCCDGDERLLVAEFMPNDTLARHLFYRKNQTMEWETRLEVAFSIAEALDYCSSAGFASYNNLDAYSILFDENGDACLSCFGLMKEIKDDQRTTGSVNPESVMFRFGTILVDLLTGKPIPPSHAHEMIHGKNVVELIDPNLKGKFSEDEATIVFKLAFKCLQYEDIESLNTKDIVRTLETLLTKTDAPSYEMLEMANHRELSWNKLSPLGKACLRMDLMDIHKILVIAEYEDDKEVVEFSFEEWIEEVKDIQEVRKHGDQAFLEQDFETAINCYSQFIDSRRTVYPSVYARRSLCYLFLNQPDRALYDGMIAQEVFPDWPTAFYLQSVALSKLNMITDSADTLKEATLLEAERQHR